ncbi:MAG TPA: PD-(D/E)XK nuclease family protein, partial [Rubrivivax sp.]|nr:PD-(D/E)XK nuclease family protein [Rubrivivax sp.]
MTTLQTIRLPAGGDVPTLWSAVAAHMAAWLHERGLAARDAVLLLPFAALLAPARMACAAEPRFAGWPPRIETPLTLAAALGPAPQTPPQAPSGDVLVDRLLAVERARRALDGVDASAAPGDVQSMAVQLVDAAHRLRHGALARAPARRGDFWDAARARCAGAGAGPAQIEARLLAEAVSWCAEGVSAASDRLYAHRPTAWVALEIGGADALIDGVLAAAQAAGVPGLRLVADTDAATPFAGVARPALARRWLADDAEDEAGAAALAVIEALDAGRAPVVLVALDRSLVRRTRALLERAGVPLIDETGWLLSTTRAAARVLALLRAAQAAPGGDAWLDWLTSWPRAEAAALRSLEAQWRGRRRVPEPAAAERLQRAAGAYLAPLADAGRRSLRSWLHRLSERLRADGSADELAADAAGAQILAALRLDGLGAWGAEADTPPMELAQFTAWVAAALEACRFAPPADAGAAVVVTPLARAIGRPFAAAVVPAADHRHLGRAAAGATLVADALAAQLGIETRAEQRLRQRLALAQLMRVSSLTLLRRRQDEGEGVDDSPDVEWLLLEAARAGAPAWPLEPAPRRQCTLHAQPVPRPAPSAAGALPAALSATQIEALRECPYRFHARAVLRLEEAAELELALAKRDYGSWLHLVLQRFHAVRAAARAAGAPAVADDVRLQQAAGEASAALQLDEAGLLPFRASFEAFAPAYLRWLERREALGWHWQAGELDASAAPAAL